MKNLSTEFLITQYFNLHEVGIWAILSKFHAINHCVSYGFLTKTFYMDEKELNRYLQRLEQMGVIDFIDEKKRKGDDPLILTMKRVL